MDAHGKKQMLLYRLFPPRKRIQRLEEYLEQAGDIDGEHSEAEEVVRLRPSNYYDVFNTD